jgi:GT2 family glycosyltransferase/glycosyltransferase involved in cell wall biosynthesis
MQVAGDPSGQDARLVRDSGLFDAKWYGAQFADAAALGLDPLAHYLRVGWRLGRDPGPAFDARWYLEHNPDVQGSGLDPLLHYLRYGRVEGRPIRTVRSVRQRLAGVGENAGLPVRGRVIASRWHPGRRERRAGAPTILYCAHASERQLFGGERSLLDVLDAAAGLGYNAVVAVPADGNADYIERLRAASGGVQAFAYAQWAHDRPLDEAVTLVFADLIARHAVDLVHVNTVVLPEPLVAARRMGRPAAVHARELVDQDPALCERIGLAANAIVERVLERSDHVIANSRATATQYWRPGRTFTVTNAVDQALAELPPPRAQNLRVGLIGSNSPKKGLDDFIELARAGLQRLPGVEFVLVGPSTPALEAMKLAGTLPTNLRLAGYRATPAQAVAETDVVVSLSHAGESFGRTVAEAMAAGRPVLAYDKGAIAELVEHGVTGLLAPHRDLEAVIKGLETLCQQPGLVATLGEAGRRRILERHTPAHLRQQLADAYRAILGRAAPPRPPEGVTVVVPIFDAFEHVRDCVEALLRHRDPAWAKVLLIDDGSTDARIAPLLQQASAQPNVRCLANERNLGYTATVNRGLAEAGSDDVVLLNSDTRVTPQWLEGLRSVAYSAPDIGSVTAMSDNAGAFSFPQAQRDNPRPDWLGDDDYAASLVQATAALEPVEVPTGSGFCLYLRRAMLDRIGGFDAVAFPRGYGEENDLCMRAGEDGWRHVVSPRAFVYHARSASFGSQRQALSQRAALVLDARYPDYAARVAQAFAAAPMQALREAVARVRDEMALCHHQAA